MGAVPGRVQAQQAAESLTPTVAIEPERGSGGCLEPRPGKQGPHPSSFPLLLAYLRVEEGHALAQLRVRWVGVGHAAHHDAPTLGACGSQG